MIDDAAPLRLRLSRDALIANWRWLAGRSGAAACGAAVKADGYGVGAAEVVRTLRSVGCRDIFVATWAEALALNGTIGDGNLSVLHGVRSVDMAAAMVSSARPVLNSVEQVARWREAGDGRPCDVMVDTGMNRLGLSVEQAMGGALDGLTIDTLMSHLACADEDSPMNADQLAAFRAVAAAVPARRASLANSAGICLGSDYAFGLTRPGLALYGGIPRVEAMGHIGRVAIPEAAVLQVRTLRRGDSVGYGATWRAPTDGQLAIINYGYADGYLRSFSDRGSASFEGTRLPVVGRVSMDLTALWCGTGPTPLEGQYVAMNFDLSDAAQASGLSPYELLTGLSRRFNRYWH
jgi:alanine racemase